MQKCRQSFDHNKNGNGEKCPCSEDDIHQNTAAYASQHVTFDQDHGPQDFRQFCKMKSNERKIKFKLHQNENDFRNSRA